MEGSQGQIYDLNPHLKGGGPSDRHCPAGEGCEGTGWLVDDTNTARPCACRGQRIAHARNRALDHKIPKRFRDVAFDREPVVGMEPGLLRHVKRYCRTLDKQLSEGKGLWFYGSTGTYKTALAMVVAQEALRASRTVVVRTGAALLNEVRRTFDDSSSLSYSEFMRRLSGTDLLFIDDLAVERTTDWVLEQLYLIINERYQEMRSIVLTTNLEEPAKLAERIGERNYSRLMEMSGPPLPVFGHDRRLESFDDPAADPPPNGSG